MNQEVAAYKVSPSQLQFCGNISQEFRKKSNKSRFFVSQIVIIIVTAISVVIFSSLQLRNRINLITVW